MKDDNFDHVKFTEQIIECAMKRAKQRLRKCEVRYKSSNGYGVYAAMDMKAGEVVTKHEEKRNKSCH